MDGYLGEWMDEWMDKLMFGWMDRLMVGWVIIWTDGQMDGLID